MKPWRKHMVIPDTQVRPGEPMDHLKWIGKYAAAKRPDVIVHLGDHWDMHSLCEYDRHTKVRDFSARSYQADIDAGNKALEMLTREIAKARGYKPHLILLRGNHEERIERLQGAEPRLAEKCSYSDFNDVALGWKPVPFLQPVSLDGILYAHYFYQPLSGRPYGGTAVYKLGKIHSSFTMGHVQGLDVGRVSLPGGRTLRGLVAGSCLTPDHRVLTADLRYIQLGDLEVGDTLVSFDEEITGRRSRRYRTGEVRALRFENAETCLVTLESGKQFKVTPDHLWLTRVGGPLAVKEGASYMWRRTNQLRVGTRLPRPLDEWSQLTTHEAGYLAGMYDGEGCYYTRQTTAGYVSQLSLSQKPGLVLDRTIAALKTVVDGEAMGCINSRGVTAIRLRGGARPIARMLGSVRPTRLLSKFRPEHLGGITTNRDDRVAAIEPLGVREILRIDIDARTMIVEGYPHHNCYLHDEDYKGPQANNHWRGILMKHEVRRGEYDLMEVSLDFLKRRFG